MRLHSKGWDRVIGINGNRATPMVANGHVLL